MPLLPSLQTCKQCLTIIRMSPTSSLCVMKGRSPRLLLRDLTTSVWLAPYLRAGRSSSRNCAETRYRFISDNCCLIVPWWWWQCGPWQAAPHWTKSSGLFWPILSFKTKATNNLLQQEIFPKVDSVSSVFTECKKRWQNVLFGGLETSEKCNDGDQNIWCVPEWVEGEDMAAGVERMQNQDVEAAHSLKGSRGYDHPPSTWQYHVHTRQQETDGHQQDV